MNKRHGMIATALIALLLVTGCSTFFQGGLSGTVTCNGKAVGGATVAVYFDKEVWEEDYKLNVDKVKPVFNTDYKTVRTAQDGSFAITNIPWDSAFPEYGKDADSIEAYVLIHHKDYGLEKYEETLHIISGRSNEINPKFKDKITKTISVNVNFKQAANNLGSHGISEFKYSYYGEPGRPTDLKCEKTVTVGANGSVKLDIEYQGEVPSISIYDIVATEYDEDGKAYTITVDDELKKKDIFEFDSAKVSSKVITIKTVPYKYRFPGFNGYITGLEDKEYTESSTVDLTVNHDGFTAKDIRNTELSSDRFQKYDRFTGLGNNIILENKADSEGKYKATIEVPCTIKIDITGGKDNNFIISSDETISRDIRVKKVVD